jgi:hypothetical protein
MAENIVAGLFGMTPEAYQGQQYQQDLKRGYELAQLSPGAAAQANLMASVGQLGRGVAGALGVQDPALVRMSQRNQLLQEIDLTDQDSLVAAAKKAASMGDVQFATGLIDRARSMAETQSNIALKQAQTLKALQPAKLTGDERYIEALRAVETKLQKGEKPTSTELSNANISGQMLSKPRSFFDQSSGQTVTIPATDPSQAFPLTYKAMAKPESEGGVAVPKPTTQQATEGNLPSGSQTAIGDIDANLKKLELSTPELQSFLSSLKSGEVKYNATSNTLDLLGATVLPAFGLEEKGAQVKKDEIKRALTERVNSLLLMAKGTQTEGDATRAADQIASTTTYLSQARMIGAIEGLMRAETKLTAELGAKKSALQSQGRAPAPNAPSAPTVAQPKTQEPTPTPKATPKSSGMTREQKIKLFIEHNGGKPTREQAIDALTKAGQL